jgi:hypothetical protein
MAFRIPPAFLLPDGVTADLDTIRSLCSSGLESCPPEDRAIAWLLLSRVFPPNTSQFESTMAAQRSMYEVFVSDFGLVGWELRTFPRPTEDLHFDVPNERLMFTIHGDVVRTPHHAVFFPPSNLPDESADPLDVLAPFQAQLRRIERVLYIFAHVNAALSYLQGFNELCCVFFYVFSQAASWFGGDMMQVETTVFYSFQQLIGSTRLQELFSTDDGSSLITHRLHEFMELLGTHMREQARLLETFEIHPLAFAFKWLNLLFAQDHMMPNLVIIWDALFSNFQGLVEYAMYLGVAHVKMIEAKLIHDNYFGSLAALQKPHIRDIRALLQWGRKFWEADQKKKTKKTRKWSFKHTKP